MFSLSPLGIRNNERSEYMLLIPLGDYIVIPSGYLVRPWVLENKERSDYILNASLPG